VREGNDESLREVFGGWKAGCEIVQSGVPENSASLFLPFCSFSACVFIFLSSLPLYPFKLTQLGAQVWSTHKHICGARRNDFVWPDLDKQESDFLLDNLHTPIPTKGPLTVTVTQIMSTEGSLDDPELPSHMLIVSFPPSVLSLSVADHPTSVEHHPATHPEQLHQSTRRSRSRSAKL
jgi:hypothetical protein